MKAIAYLETETVLVEDTAAKTSQAPEAQDLPTAFHGEGGTAGTDTAQVAAENERMRAELAEG